MKGIFTAGVLDYFLEKELEFDCIVGVSAGAIHACSFLSKQKNRSRDITRKFIKDKRYCSLSNLRKSGDLFDAKFAYYDIPEKYFPFDHKTFNKSKTKFFVTVTDIVKGKAKHIQIKNFNNGEIEVIRASSSLPFIANNVKYKGKEYLDGGISEPLPLKKLEKEGYKKNVVVLTKPLGHKKRATKYHLVAKGKYKKYPMVPKLLKNRHISYNDDLDYILKEEEAGNVFVIRPSKNFIRRLSKNLNKLELAYNDGYEVAKKLYPKVIEFMRK